VSVLDDDLLFANVARMFCPVFGLSVAENLYYSLFSFVARNSNMAVGFQKFAWVFMVSVFCLSLVSLGGYKKNDVLGLVGGIVLTIGCVVCLRSAYIWPGTFDLAGYSFLPVIYILIMSTLVTHLIRARLKLCFRPQVSLYVAAVSLLWASFHFFFEAPLMSAYPYTRIYASCVGITLLAISWIVDRRMEWVGR
jgi:hypothetical protein